MTMTNERPGPVQRVPTLTEEVLWPQPPAHSAPAGEPVREPPLAPATEPVTEPPAPPEPPPGPAPTPPPQRDPASPAPISANAAAAMPSVLDEEQLTERILAGVQRQVDQVLEYRVREALTPILTRATDTLMRDTRNELSRSLRDLVARSVAEELRRHRIR